MAAPETHQLAAIDIPVVCPHDPIFIHLHPSIHPLKGLTGKASSSVTLDSGDELDRAVSTLIPAMEALRGVRSLRSAAARVAQQRRVSSQPAKYLKENADTTKLSSAEAATLGAAKKPPGRGNDTPGSFMHQQSNLSTKNNKFLQPWLLPIYPMVGMVAIGVGLAIMTAYRELAANPQVLVDKDKRTEELPEMHDKEWAMHMSRRYVEGNPLRKVSREHKISPFGRHLDEDVADGPVLQIGRLPGDENPAHGPAGK